MKTQLKKTEALIQMKKIKINIFLKKQGMEGRAEVNAILWITYSNKQNSTLWYLDGNFAALCTVSWEKQTSPDKIFLS